MVFFIQAGNPRASGVKGPGDSTIDEAMEAAFPVSAERAILFWHGLAIALSYKYDLSLMMVDLLNALGQIAASPTGRQSIAWPTSGFACQWHIAWDGDRVSVEIECREEFGPLLPLVAARPKIEIGTQQFLGEFRRPLILAREALTIAGWRDAELVDLLRLSALIGAIPRDGILYREADLSGAPGPGVDKADGPVGATR